MTNRSLDSLSPTETLELETSLTLIPRIKLLLTVHRADHSVPPLDKWKFKRSLKKTFPSVSLSDDDVAVRKFKYARKRKREDAVARGALYVRDLGFQSKPFSRSEKEEVAVEELERKFLEWRGGVVEKMDGIELNLEGVRFRLIVAVPVGDDFDAMRKEREEVSAFGNRGFGVPRPFTYFFS